jgi:predicted type IV restriction endonuclease
MDFIEKIQLLAQKIAKEKDHIQTEEATKNAFVLPFINALGYDIFSPLEVVPEYTADVGIKKGERVDYAVLKDGRPIMLFECKGCGCDLNSVHMSQLYRYFSVTEARIGVLTNGIVYRFFSDLEKPNQMDNKSFLEFNLAEVEEPLVEELKKLTKPAFDVEEILTNAVELKYTREIKHTLEEQLESPSEAFVKLLGAQVYSGRMTQAVLQQFTDITKRAMRQFVNDQINKRLKSALRDDKTAQDKQTATEEKEDTANASSNEESERRVVTTVEELEGFYIIKSILREIIDPSRIVSRDTASYFGVLLDDNNRKPICRFHFDRAKKLIGLFDNEEKKEDRVPVGKVDDLYGYADRLRKTITFYERQS